MEAAAHRKLKTGANWQRHFAPANGDRMVLKKGAGLADTLYHLPRLVHATLDQTRTLSKALKGDSSKETCRNIWHFLYDHIQYVPDRKGFEELRSPNRLWQDRAGDCDCYAFTISSILTNLEIGHRFRIIRQEGRAGFHHIYVIVPQGREHITIDPVLNRFNEEPVWAEKLDQTMDLHFLNGVSDPASDIGYDYADTDENAGLVFTDDSHLSIDAIDLMNGDLSGDGLGLFKRRKKGKGKFREKLKNFGKKVRNGLKKGLHAINRVNPAAGLLRLGILASLRLNLMKVAERLRWAYVAPDKALRMGIKPNQVNLLRNVRSKIEKLFNGAGGKVGNLKKAILSGKGNRDGKLRHAGPLAGNLGNADDIRVVIGDDLYHSEVVTVEGLHGTALGEIATASAIAAASAAMAALKKLLDALGFFKPKDAVVEAEPDPAPDLFTPDQGIEPGFQKSFRDRMPMQPISTIPASSLPTTRMDERMPEQRTRVNQSAQPQEVEQEDVMNPEGGNDKEEKFLDTTTGKWVVYGGSGLVVAGLIVWGVVRANRPEEPTPKNKPRTSLNGARRKPASRRSKINTSRVELV